MPWTSHVHRNDDRIHQGLGASGRGTLFLEWSHSDAEPITLYPHAERRLNVFFMHSGNREIRPTVTPYPVRFFNLFNQLELRQIKAVRFKIRIIAKDCRAVELSMTVLFGDDYSHPTVELEL
ncbi:MAG TPA: hypothetical protein VLK33_05145 [Terriglobales bacterium]|nr:hypothetical protein [Terriglobales bacterium]